MKNKGKEKGRRNEGKKGGKIDVMEEEDGGKGGRKRGRRKQSRM